MSCQQCGREAARSGLHVARYKLENTCTESHTTRKRSKNHGYGLQNVSKCIAKHNGEMVTSYKDGKFTFTSRITC